LQKKPVGGSVGLFPIRATFRDPVHAVIPVNELEYEIIQHPMFLRLHGIKQLAFSYLVYPQAKHTRFEHSLGSMHVAYLMTESFRKNSPEEVRFLTKDGYPYEAFVQLTRLVALLHDVGHAPYSHATEQVVEEAFEEGAAEGALAEFLAEAMKRGLKFHEASTCWIAKRVLESAGGKFGDRARPVLDAAAAVLCGEGSGRWEEAFAPEALKLARSVVSGQVADADRMDYLVRDAHNTGATYGRVDISRLASSVFVRRVEGGLELAYPAKLVSNIEELYFSRYMMYKWVYFHHKVSSIELAYSFFLKKLASEWPSLLGVVEKLLPNPPERFWDLFHPSTVWRYTVELGVRFDDGLVDSLMRLASSGAGSEELKFWARAVLERKPVFVPVAKRQEVLLARLARASARLGLTGASEEGLALVEVGLRRLSALLSAAKKLGRSLEKVARDIERAANKKLEGSGAAAYVKVYPPIVGEELREPYIDVGEELLPIDQVSSLVRALHEVGRVPIVYAYLALGSNADRRSAEEAVVEALAEYVEEICREAELEGHGESLHRDLRVRAQQERL